MGPAYGVIMRAATLYNVVSKASTAYDVLERLHGYQYPVVDTR